MGKVGQELKVSFERVYPALRKGLRGYLFRRGLVRARAFKMRPAEYGEVLDEATDEALCRAWKRLDRYDPEKAPLGWWVAMHGLKVLKRALDRWLHDRQGCSSLEVVGELPTPRALPELRSVEDRDRLGRALRALPREQAHALALAYLHDLSAEEIGGLLGRSPDAVHSLLQRAKANAQEALEGRPVRRRGRPRKGGYS